MKEKLIKTSFEISWVIMKFFFKVFLLALWGISRLFEVLLRELNERLSDYLKFKH